MITIIITIIAHYCTTTTTIIASVSSDLHLFLVLNAR